MSDPGTSYRTRDEIKKMKQSSDPIQGIKIRALEANLATEDDFKVYTAYPVGVDGLFRQYQ